MKIDNELMWVLIVSVICYGIGITMYYLNIGDVKHSWDCTFFANTNATGFYNYDCGD